MPAYIIQDAYTGYIWGDSRDFASGLELATGPAEACCLLDESVGTRGRIYEQVSRLSGDSGYLVYRADINGSESVPVVRDGQDRETIEAVERDCELIAHVEWTDSQD